MRAAAPAVRQAGLAVDRRYSALRAQVESALGAGLAFAFRERPEAGTFSTGVPEVDALVGGLPRGGLTEIIGPNSSGRTSLLLSVLAEITRREEVAALVDAGDAFDPWSAQAAGVELERLLWVRARCLEPALKAADWLVQAGGFGLVAIDLGDVPTRMARRVPLACWFRLSRAVENTPTALVVLEQEPFAKTCASLVLGLEAEAVEFRNSTVTHACLLCGARLGVEVVRSRSKLETRKSAFDVRNSWVA